MKKVNDWFVAGLIAGVMGGVGIFLLNVILLLFTLLGCQQPMEFY